MSETREQAKVIKALRAGGCPVQKFSDAFALGVPDMLVGGARGIWVECKYHLLPKMARTPLMPLTMLTGPQQVWLRRWNGQPLPTAVLLFTGSGWLLCPTEYLSVLVRLPMGQTRHLQSSLVPSRLTEMALWDNYEAVIAYCQAEGVGCYDWIRKEE